MSRGVEARGSFVDPWRPAHPRYSFGDAEQGNAGGLRRL